MNAYPFTEAEVDPTGPFESDFMVRHMRDLTFSPEARTVLDRGRDPFRRAYAALTAKLRPMVYEYGFLPG